MKWPAFAIAMVAFASSPAHAATVLYGADFENGAPNGWRGDVTSVTTAPAGQKFLGLFERKPDPANPNAPQGVPVYSTLNLATAGYTSLKVTFDLYAINGLDGDNFFSFAAQNSELLNASFSNIFPYPQTYGGPDSPGGTGSDPALFGALGYSPQMFDDYTYHLSFFVPVTSSMTSFRLGGRSSSFGDGAFGVDNFKVEGFTSAAVPEPATWAMMIMGFSLIGGSMRAARRQQLGRLARA